MFVVNICMYENVRFTSLNVDIEIFCLTEWVNVSPKHTITSNYGNLEKGLKFGNSFKLLFFSS